MCVDAAGLIMKLPLLVFLCTPLFNMLIVIIESFLHLGLLSPFSRPWVFPVGCLDVRCSESSLLGQLRDDWTHPDLCVSADTGQVKLLLRLCLNQKER